METERHIGFLLETIILLGLAAIVPMFFFYYRRRLLTKERQNQIAVLKAMQETEELQKLKISDNLHDEVIPILSQIVTNIDLNLIIHSKGKIDTGLMMEERQLALTAQESMRTIALDLTPKVLMDLGLINALSSHISRLRSDKYLITIVNKSDFDEKLPFTKADEVNIYRASLEIIKNLQKHETFSWLTIKVSNDNHNLIIIFSHNGKGITDKEINSRRHISQGLGLRSLSSRLITLRATMNYRILEKSAEVIFLIPINT